jgi:hypothetical protein
MSPNTDASGVGYRSSSVTSIRSIRAGRREELWIGSMKSCNWSRLRASGLKRSAWTLEVCESASGWHRGVKKGTTSNRQIPRWMGNQDSSGRSGCLNGRKLRAFSGQCSRCTGRPRVTPGGGTNFRVCPCYWTAPMKAMRLGTGARVERNSCREA